MVLKFRDEIGKAKDLGTDFLYVLSIVFNDVVSNYSLGVVVRATVFKGSFPPSVIDGSP